MGYPLPFVLVLRTTRALADLLTLCDGPDLLWITYICGLLWIGLDRDGTSNRAAGHGKLWYRGWRRGVGVAGSRTSGGRRIGRARSRSRAHGLRQLFVRIHQRRRFVRRGCPARVGA